MFADKAALPLLIQRQPTAHWRPPPQQSGPGPSEAPTQQGRTPPSPPPKPPPPERPRARAHAATEDANPPGPDPQEEGPKYPEGVTGGGRRSADPASVQRQTAATPPAAAAPHAAREVQATPPPPPRQSSRDPGRPHPRPRVGGSQQRWARPPTAGNRQPASGFAAEAPRRSPMGHWEGRRIRKTRAPGEPPHSPPVRPRLNDGVPHVSRRYVAVRSQEYPPGTVAPLTSPATARPPGKQSHAAPTRVRRNPTQPPEDAPHEAVL